MYRFHLGCIYYVLYINKSICEMIIEIHLDHEVEEKVEFSADGIDYECHYENNVVRSNYPVSHNNIHDRISWASDEFMYCFIQKDSLESVDGTVISDKQREEICRHLELKLNT